MNENIVDDVFRKAEADDAEAKFIGEFADVSDELLVVQAGGDDQFGLVRPTSGAKRHEDVFADARIVGVELELVRGDRKRRSAHPAADFDAAGIETDSVFGRFSD